MLTPSLSKDSTILSKSAGDTPQGVQKRPRSCQGDAETMSSPCTGASLQTAQNPMKQQQGLRQVHLTPWEEGRDGAGQEDSWLSLCIRAQAEHKRRVPHLGGGRLGTMQTQRAILVLGRWSLWLLLLGLVVSSTSAQDLSYREAVLRAVDQLNDGSTEANLYCLLELDLPPKDVSWGGAEPSPPSFGHTVAASLRLVLLSGRHFSL